MKPLANVELPPPLTVERLLILKSQALIGDEAAKKELVMGHVRIAFSIAGRYARRGADSEDMTSAALEGVVSAVDKIANGDLSHDNIPGYICAYVHRFCSDFIDRNNPVHTPRGQKRRPTQSLPDVMAVTDFDVVAFDDTLEQIFQSDFEKYVVELRRLGYTDQEVADRINVSRTKVTTTRLELLNRYRSLSDV